MNRINNLINKKIILRNCIIYFNILIVSTKYDGFKGIFLYF